MNINMIFKIKETYLKVLFKDFGEMHKEAFIKGTARLCKDMGDAILKDSKFYGQNPIIMPLQFYSLEKGSWN